MWISRQTGSGEREIEIGDPLFDSAFVILGPAPQVSALLDEETRRLLFLVNAEGWLELSCGRFRADLKDGMVPYVLPLLLDLCKRLAAPLDISRRLAENARQDSAPGVRFHNLLLLLREFPEDPRTAEALREARSDRSPWVRLRVAKALGAEGRGMLFELAQGLEDDAVSAEAVSILDRELPFDLARAILDQALNRGCLRTAGLCLEAIVQSGAPTGADALEKVLERGESELGVAAARALGVIGNPAAEPWLISALQSEQADVRVAAAKALARVGSTAAVLPLKEAAERSRLDLELRRAARQAIAEIQSRAEGASPGQLSLAGAEAGQLSLAETDQGRLSLAEDPAGQLSLPPEERSPWPK